MTRLFQTHFIRKEIALNPVWDFWTLNDKEERIKAYKMPVPCCWESNPELASYRGKAIYSQKVILGGNLRLNFKGISHTARIYLDKNLIGSHYNAYTEFDIILTDVIYGEHLLEIVADNSFHEESSLHISNDYYSYGGITRPVLIEQLGDLYIKQLHFMPHRINGEWNAIIKVKLCNLSGKALASQLKLQLEEKEALIAAEDIAPGSEIIVEGSYTFSSVQEYSPECPRLYQLKASLVYEGKEIDDLIDRVGFREIAVKNSDILFNGRKLKIKGVNRHEDYAEFGCAIPLEAMYRDIELIKSLGANCIRTCHYPNDERFLDLCDENGIIVWEESHARGLKQEQMAHKNFEKQSADCIREMIDNHMNHPSIFVWGLLNECASDTAFGRSCYNKQISLIKSLDTTRPVTFASCHTGKDICLDLVDIVSFNIYPGWYRDVSTKAYLEELKEFINSARGEGKPIIISEIGAGGIYGYRSGNRDKWTEDYQEAALEEQLNAVLSDKDISGAIIWQYADCRVDQGWFSYRPKSQNNKGLVDMYRREKLAYRKVKEIYTRNEELL